MARRRRAVPGRRCWRSGSSAVVALIGGVAMGLYYPAYSALVPALLPAGDLLAANGLEGVVRPMLAQAAGPAVAGLPRGRALPRRRAGGRPRVAALAAGGVRRGAAGHAGAPGAATAGRRWLGLLADVREGFRYMVRTPWLLATLLFAVADAAGRSSGRSRCWCRSRSRTPGAGPASTRCVLAAFGIGGAVGSLVVASLRLPRRYLTVMNVLWGAGLHPAGGLRRSPPSCG